MNILHLSAVKNWGGGEHQIQNLVLELSRTTKQVENTILCVKNSRFHQVLRNTKLSFLTAPLLLNLDLRYSLKIIKICAKNKIDLIHIHDPKALALVILADKVKKLPPFVFSKKTSFPIKNRERTLYKYNYYKIKRILCVSNKTRQIITPSIQEPEKLKTIYHGTQLNTTKERASEIREKLKLPQEAILVGTIANHIRAKSFDTYVNMVDVIVNKMNRKDFHFVEIGGFDKFTSLLENEIKSKKLEEFISILGYLPNASSYIPQFDISVLTSQSEGLPQFLYESCLHKVPIVSTNVGGIPELIEDGVNGFLTEPHDPEALAKKLIKLSDNKNLQKKFSEASYTKLLKNFITEKMAQQTLIEYKNVLHEKS